MKRLLIFSMIYLLATTFATAIEYKIATESEIGELYEKINAETPSELKKSTPYSIEIRSSYENKTYHFTYSGHFAHPSVVIKRHVFLEGKTYPKEEVIGITAKAQKKIEKWIEVINKPINNPGWQGVDPGPICGQHGLDTKKGLKCYEKVARSNPESIKAQLDLGFAYIYANDEAATKNQYEKLKKLDYSAISMLMGFGVAAMKPEWMEYYREDYKQVEKVTEAQQLLDSLGYETGPLVGSIVPELEAAIRSFQRDANLTVNGRVSESLLESLRTWGK